MAMKHLLKILSIACAATAAGAVAADKAAPAMGRLPAELVAAPALRVSHASKAMLLAATQAGSRVVAVGERGTVLLSDDLGKTFRQAREVPVDVTLTSVSFADERQGWAVGHWGVVLATKDGGETWAVQRKDVQVDRPLFGVHFFDASHGVAVGLWSLVLTTGDGGTTWRNVELAPPEGAKKADLNLLGLFTDARGSVFAAAEKGMVLRSNDRGATWSYAASGFKGSLWAGLALPDGVLLAGGLRGALYRSADDGRSWTRIDTGSKSSITGLAARGREVLAVGLDGLVLRSADGGATFSSEARSDRAALTSALMTSNGMIYFSRQGVAGPPTGAKNQ